MSQGPMSERFARWEGDHLLVPPDGFIQTSHCTVCVRPRAQTARLVTFSATQGAALPLFLLLGCFGPILFLAARYRRVVTVEVPLCLDCDDRWRRVDRWFRPLAILGLFAIPFAFFELCEMARPELPLDPELGAVVGLFAWGWRWRPSTPCSCGGTSSCASRSTSTGSISAPPTRRSFRRPGRKTRPRTP